MTGQTTERCAIVVDATLAPGLAANAAAVLAVTLGATVAGLAGPDLVDADGTCIPGLFEKGLPVLGAGATLARPARAGAAAGVGVIDIPAVGQQTNDYDDVLAHVARTATADARVPRPRAARLAPRRQPGDRDPAAVGPTSPSASRAA